MAIDEEINPIDSSSIPDKTSQNTSRVKNIQCLLVQNNPSDILLIRDCLERINGIKINLLTSKSMQEGIDLLSKQNVDLIIFDLSLNGNNNFELFRESSHRPNLPVIALTSDKNTAIYAIENGAQDYIIKSKIDDEIFQRSIKFALDYKNIEPQLSMIKKFSETTGCGFCFFDVNGCMLHSNRAFLEMMQIDDDIKEFNVKTFYPVDTCNELFAKILSLAEKDGQWFGEVTFQTSKNRIIKTIQNVLLILDENQKPLCFANMIIDISRRNEMSDNLRILSFVVEKSPAAVMVTDIKGNIEYVNKKFIEVTGYLSKDVIGKNPRILKTGHTTKEQYRELWETIIAGNEWRGELRNKKKNGELFWEYAVISPIKSSDNKITHFLAVKEDLTNYKKVEEKLLHKTHFDDLTDLPNRALVHDRISQSIARAKRLNHSVGVMFIDLDHFKNVNETMGHQIGDDLLIEAAKRLTTTVRSSDTVARLGGDEFLVVLPDFDAMTHSTVVSRKIIESFSSPFIIDEQEIFVTASIGISVYPNDGENVQALMQNSESAMYKAKEEFRNTVRFYTQSMNDTALDRMKMESHLRYALQKKDFKVFYQPVIDINSRKIVGAEALLRWQSPDLGMVYPDKFIPLSEETGLIVPIGEWVLLTACKQAKQWQNLYGRPYSISVNVSYRQFKGSDIISPVKNALSQSGLNPKYLELEITERLFMEEIPRTTEILNELNGIGVRLSIDDFGTGYSSLGYLQKYPFDVLKIDKTFIQNVLLKKESTELSKAIIFMAHSLGLVVVAEGIEKEDQVEFLKANFCDRGQGYLFNKPIPSDEFDSLLSNQKNS